MLSFGLKINIANELETELFSTWMLHRVAYTLLPTFRRT
jgi:hypothetical protein